MMEDKVKCFSFEKWLPLTNNKVQEYSEDAAAVIASECKTYLKIIRHELTIKIPLELLFSCSVFKGDFKIKTHIFTYLIGL